MLVIATPVHDSNRDDWAFPHASAFAREEIATLFAWVNDGGGLLLVADHSPIPGALADLGTVFGGNESIRITIAVNGSCSVDAINFTGPACQAATMEITAALGGQIDHQHSKPEARIRGRCGEAEREQAR